MDGGPDIPPPGEGGFRLVHTADWHLGKTLGNLDRLPEAHAFLRWLAQFLEEARVDALVIAGDVFDSATPPQAALRLYYDFLATLHRHGRTRVVVTAGNHDSPGVLESPRDLLRAVGTQVIGSLPAPEAGAEEALLVPLPSREAARVVVAAVPFLRERDLRTGHLGQSAEEIARELQEGIAAIYARAAAAARRCWPGVPVMATGHLTVVGARGSESEREIHIGGLGAISADRFPPAFAYVALGHLHRPQKVGGQETIRYAGSPMALSFGEVEDRKEIRLLEWSAQGDFQQYAVPVPVSRALFRLRVARGELAAGLKATTVPSSPLRPWAEVVVSGGVAAEGNDLCREVREAAQGAAFDVVRITTDHAAAPAALDADEGAQEEAVRALLSEPKAVFRRRLEQETLEEAERERLLVAFDELCQLHAERCR